MGKRYEQIRVLDDRDHVTDWNEGADVLIDGERWTSSHAGEFVIQLTAGSHRVEIAKPGYQRFAAEVHIRERETEPLNVVLSSAGEPGMLFVGDPATYLTVVRLRVEKARTGGGDSE